MISVRQIFANTAPTYLESCLNMRQPGSEGAGSRFVNPISIDQLTNAKWEAYRHAAIKAPAIGFRASIPGHVGIVPIKDLPNTAQLTLRDRKGVGFLEAEYPMPLGPRVEHTTLLAGPSREDPEKLVVWTFFPGDPISPSQLEVSDQFRDGLVMTVDHALRSGILFVKAV